jgi:hypothetical protein
MMNKIFWQKKSTKSANALFQVCEILIKIIIPFTFHNRTSYESMCDSILSEEIFERKFRLFIGYDDLAKHLPGLF